MRDPLTEFPGYALRRASNAANGELAARLAGHGLRLSSASAMILIGANSRITASALGRALDIQRANMVPLLKRLEDDGLIVRTPIDGKSQGLALTDEGKKRVAQAETVIREFEAKLIARVPAEHRAHLLPALKALWR